VGYNVELVLMVTPANTVFPVEAPKAKRLRSQAKPFEDAQAVREVLLSIQGCRPGPGDTVDYLGRGFSYARFSVRTSAIHVENDCSGKELLVIYDSLIKTWPNLLIFDLQSEQLHNGKSFLEWWSKPL